MRIDAHNHAIPAAALDLLRTDPTYRVRIEGRRWRGGNHVDFEIDESFVDPDAKLEELRRNGMDGAIVSAAPPLFYYEADPGPGEQICAAVNEGLHQMSEGSDQRLFWLAHVPMQDPEGAAAVLKDAVERPGCVGGEVGSSIAGRRLDLDEFEPFWAAAEQLRAPVMIHPDTSYEPHHGLSPYYLQNVIGNQLETTLTIERLICAGVLRRHPGLRLLLVHGGGYFPYQAGRLRHARAVRPELVDAPEDPWAYLPQLWFDPITHDQAALRYLIDRVGVENVVLGTDLPFDMALRDPVASLELAGIDATQLDRVAQSNVRELFDLPGNETG
jgi:aminocarboxymuconate-semialdehyde decarboxylase